MEPVDILCHEKFKTLYDNGKFTEEITKQYYDEAAGVFLADRYIEGTCPKCATTNQYGDNCEKCGATYRPTDLIDPKSTLSDSTPVLKKSVHYFFKLSSCLPQVNEWINE